MRIINVETVDIADIKTVIEILNGFISEANADFIRDVVDYNEKISKKSKNDINSENKQSKKKKKKSKNDTISSESTEDDKEVNNGEIKILTSDPNQVMLTFIKLKGSAFKTFEVLPEKYSVGINIDELYKYIKNVDKEGVLSIQLDSDETQYITFKVTNENTSKESICDLRVVNMNNNKDKKIEADVSMAVRISCADFHKACKDLSQFSQYIEITCDPTKFEITCAGDLSKHSRTFKADGGQNSIGIKVMKKPDEDDDEPNIIRLIFDLKYINVYYKCSSLCDDMEIYLNTDSVMFLKYGIKLMGEMIVCIAPHNVTRGNTDNYDQADEEFYEDDEEVQLI